MMTRRLLSPGWQGSCPWGCLALRGQDMQQKRIFCLCCRPSSRQFKTTFKAVRPNVAMY